VNPKESKGFTRGARQMNPGFTESRGGAMNTESRIVHVGLPHRKLEGRRRTRLTSGSFVGNPGFGMYCHPLDSVNPGFIWRAPLVNPCIHLQRFMKWAKTNLESEFCFIPCADCPRRLRVLRAHSSRVRLCSHSHQLTPPGRTGAPAHAANTLCSIYT